MQQWNKRRRRKTAATSEEEEDILQEFQEERRARDQKANSRVFDWATGSEWLDTLAGLASSKRKGVTYRARPSEKNKDDVGTYGPAHTASGNHSERAALRREQREELEGDHHEIRATGKEGEFDHRHYKHSPRNRRNGGTSVGYSGRIALRKEQRGMQTRC
jgi:hypothetical protein